MIYLGIDFGLKHIGLAIADGPLAEPLGEKINNDRLYPYLKNLIAAEKIDRVIIGLPDGKLAGKVRDFGASLARISGRTIIYQDETLTSREAQHKLQSSGAPLKKRRRDHRAAAALILQQFLDMLNERRIKRCLKT